MGPRPGRGPGRICQLIFWQRCTARPSIATLNVGLNQKFANDTTVHGVNQKQLVKKNVIPKQYRYQLYYAYHYSQICYGIETYGVATKSNLNKIQRLQKKIIKVLFYKDWLTPTNDLHRELKILKVEDVHKSFTLLNHLSTSNT